MMTLFLGVGPDAADAFPPAGDADPGSNRALVREALARGQRTTFGVIDDLAEVTLPDGSRRPWHPGLNPYALRYEQITLRNAAFVIVIALSMMRDSEIHEIERNSIIEHFGSPAIRSTKQKHDPNAPERAWWVIDVVAEAIVMAEAVSRHPELVFSPLAQPKESYTAHAQVMLDAFVKHINRTSAWTGLAEIPPGRYPAHMWRRTMAMLTDQFPGSEIALGIQLKHVAQRALANRVTGGLRRCRPRLEPVPGERDRRSALPRHPRPLCPPQGRRSHRSRPRDRAGDRGVQSDPG